MIKGTIYITHDINLCLANLNTCKTIAVVDEPNMYNIPDKIGGSLLLPPYEALAALIDDNIDAFKYEYITYLSSDISVVKFINIILQALIAGTNILLFVESEGPDFIMTFKEFFMMNFGILIGDENNAFQYDITYFPNILNRLYAEDEISKEYYLNLYPQDIPFDIFTIKKLSYEYAIMFNNDTEAGMYFKKLSKVFKNGGKIQGVVKRLG